MTVQLPCTSSSTLCAVIHHQIVVTPLAHELLHV